MKLETTPSAAGEVKPLKICREWYRKHLTQRAGDRLTIWKRCTDLIAGPPEKRPGRPSTRAHGQPLVPVGILVSMMLAPDERIHRESPRRSTSACGHLGSNITISFVSTELTRAEVARIAALAHLELTETETARFTSQLGDILSYFGRLQEVDTTGVEATTNPVAATPVMRDDTLCPSMTSEQVLANAPDPGPRGVFRVPKVIG